MALTEKQFANEECLSCFGRTRVGHLAVPVSGFPVVVLAPYVVDELGFLIGIQAVDVAMAMCRNVVALHADGFDEDAKRHWSVLAVGLPVLTTVEQEQQLLEGPWVPIPWYQPHVFRLQPQRLSGHWVD